MVPGAGLEPARLAAGDFVAFGMMGSYRMAATFMPWRAMVGLPSSQD